MNYLSGALRYVAGGESAPTVSIPRLVDRLTSASLPQDRRSALSALVLAASASPSRQALVAELVVKPLYAVLEQDADYDDTVKAALDLLLALCGTLDPPTDPHALVAAMLDSLQGDSLPQNQLVTAFEQASARAAQTNVDMFLGLPAAVSLLLALLDKNDFYLRFTTIELLTAMAANSRPTLQAALLEAPQGVSRICDLLDDTHRLLRSNAVLLLSTLCNDSSEISKIVAYAGVLEKLFALIESPTRNPLEPYPAEEDDDDDDDDNLEAAIVVQDVLYVLRNLIRGASTTRTMFRDSGSLTRLVNLIQRTALDASMPTSRQIAASASGRKIAVEKQARKNLIIAMQCIAGLAQDADSETRLVKNDLATTNLFNILAGLAFAPVTKLQPKEQDERLPEHVLNVRVGALKTLALLARGHDDFRSMFASVTFSVAAEGEATCAQKAALSAMFGDSSSAVRVASYAALRESLVMDAGLDLPSSSLLNAMTSAAVSTGLVLTDRSTALPRNQLSSNDLASSKNPLAAIAESLKVALVDWHNVTDAAGVFYAASLMMWILARIDGARERLLMAYVHGSSLLPQVIRVLGKLERENGSPEIRIALFSLACTWLHGSAPAVSAFLSSAMHLPMLVDVLNGTGVRGDIAEVHTRGLSAVLLGICLQATDATSDSGFISGSGGASMVIPRGTVADVIRNRIGVTVFTASLDDMRASKAYVSAKAGESLWAFAEKITVTEETTGYLSRAGNLGHDRWYGADVVGVVNDVYKNIGARALDLLSDQSPLQNGIGGTGASHLLSNGHVGNGQYEPHGQKAVLADSVRDEVLNSYKEFIRSQDESLNAARRQIEELATALRETQKELDVSINDASRGNDLDKNSSLQTANEELLAQKEALEALVEEKNRDFAALSDAYAALEEDSQAADNLNEASGSAAAEVSSLRSQNVAIRSSLNDEVAKTVELGHKATLLDSELRAKCSELTATIQERDMLKANVQPDLSEALQWRTRADTAEAKLLSCQSVLDSVRTTKKILETQLADARRNEDAVASELSLERELEASRADLEELRSTRRRELQVARESSHVAAAAAQDEIAILKSQLTEARQAQSQAPVAGSVVVRGEEMQEYERMKSEHRSLVSTLEEVKTSLADTQGAVLLWQKRAEAEERAKMQEKAENSRLGSIAQELQKDVHALKSSAASESELASARVVELQQQNAELNEMRRRADEEAKSLKEDVAARTEQSIRLSGQLYETEEAKEKVEQKLAELQQELSNAQRDHLQSEREVSMGGVARSNVEQTSGDLQLLVSALQEQLEATKDALIDSNDAKSLAEAKAREREAAVEKAASLEERLTKSQITEEKLTADVDFLRERLLSLDEAEEAKRALTMQVVELQNSLAQVSPATSSLANAKLSDSEQRVKGLQNQVQEKELRLQGLESSLTAALDRADVSDRKIADTEKQVAESETMVSVLSSEKDSLLSECDRLRRELDARAPVNDMDMSAVQNMEQKLQETESRRVATSKELASQIDACRGAEEEARRLRIENEDLRLVVSRLESELHAVQREKDTVFIGREVENIVNSIVLNSLLSASSETSSEIVATLTQERDTAISVQSQQSERLDTLTSELASLRAMIEEREVALAASKTEVDRLTQQTENVTDLQETQRERDQLLRSLEDSKSFLSNLEKDNENLKGLLQEANALKPSNQIQPVSQEECKACAEAAREPGHSRVAELEGALRDAARTVSATNLELIAAQALLVELSADKTAIRTELASAQEKIENLKSSLSVESRAPKNESLISEVSEPEQTIVDDFVNGCPSCSDKEVTEESFRGAQANVENLRTILRRTASEADCAVSLLSTVELKFEQIEREFHLSKSSLDDANALEKKLLSELADLKQSHEIETAQVRAEVDQLSQRLAALHIEKDDASTKLSNQLKAVEASLSVKQEEFRAQLSDKEGMIEKLKQREESLTSQLHDVTENLMKLSERAGALEEGNNKYRAATEALEDKLASEREALAESKRREKSLEVSLQQSKDDLQRERESFDGEVRRLKSASEREVEELEAEVERSNLALENAERTFRISETSLKTTLKTTRTELESALESKEKTIADLLSTSEMLEASSEEVKELKSLQLKAADETERVVAELRSQRDEALSDVHQLRAELEAKSRALASITLCVEKLERKQKDAQGQISMLEGENEDYLSSIQSLETKCKRFGDNLSRTEAKLSGATVRFEKCSAALDRQTKALEDTSTELKQSKEKCRSVEEQELKLTKQVDNLREELDRSVEAREEVERDNEDLKAWVADLERQATDLHRAAEDFSDVEESLRQTMDSLRQVAEQNAGLTEDLKKEREVVANLEAQLRGAVREKNAAEGARDASKRRTSNLESRLRKIREDHVNRVSNSEAGMRGMVERCVELETKLAAAERELAEVASVSDTLFGVQAELGQKEEDMKSVRERASVAEERAEDLESKVQRLEAELAEGRESGSGEAYRVLEAEHNELLVCLAEMEYECTTLKEELGRD